MCRDGLAIDFRGFDRPAVPRGEQMGIAIRANGVSHLEFELKQTVRFGVYEVAAVEDDAVGLPVARIVEPHDLALISSANLGLLSWSNEIAHFDR